MNARNREAIEARIQEIYERDGKVTADAVIEEAKDPKSPLHGEFEWDVEKAAMEAWRETARRLIRSVRVQVHTETWTVAVPRYVRNPESPQREQSYAEAADLRGDHDRAMASLAYEIERADGAIRRAEKVAMSVGLSDEIEFVASAIQHVKEAVKKSA
jgi:hypothetical protein